jgi:phosphoglycerate kinase
MTVKKHLKDLDFKGRRVLTRVDFNVPLTSDGRVADDTRIRAALPTIEFIREHGGKAVLASHLGRPKDMKVPDLSLRPVSERLSKLIGRGVTMAPDCVGDTTEGVVARMNDGDVTLLENLRFHAGETRNEPDFAHRLARMGDVYVNDAFGTAHRAHASTVGVTRHFNECAMGFLIENELRNLAKATESPERPYAVILGGAKVSGKIGVIENLMPMLDVLLIGGGMAFTFLKAKGISVGDSLVEDDRIDTAARILERAEADGRMLLLPDDLVVAQEVTEGAETRIVPADGIEEGWKGLDIGPQTIRSFSDAISAARTIIWNGPLGVFELDAFSHGTVAVAEAVAKATDSGAISIIGGGDSIAAVGRAGVAGRITHISTGGGASLAVFEGKALPAIEALTDA